MRALISCVYSIIFVAIISDLWFIMEYSDYWSVILLFSCSYQWHVQIRLRFILVRSISIGLRLPWCYLDTGVEGWLSKKPFLKTGGWRTWTTCVQTWDGGIDLDWHSCLHLKTRAALLGHTLDTSVANLE